MLRILKNSFENKTEHRQHFAAVLKLSATHFLKQVGRLWSPLLEDLVEIEKGKENDQEEVAASLRGTVKKVVTLCFVEKVAKGWCTSQLHKTVKVKGELNADLLFAKPEMLEARDT